MKYRASTLMAFSAVLSFSGLLPSDLCRGDELTRDASTSRIEVLNSSISFRRRPQPSRNHTDPGTLSAQFISGLCELSARIGCDRLDLLAVMMKESSLRADAYNPSSNASGLIQFLPSTLANLGWTGTPEEFREIGAEDQLPWIEAFLLPSSKFGLDSAGKLYQAVFMPNSLRQASSDDMALIDVRGINSDRYDRNRGLDIDGDGRITVGELQQAVEACKKTPEWRLISNRVQSVRNAGQSNGPDKRRNRDSVDYISGTQPPVTSGSIRRQRWASSIPVDRATERDVEEIAPISRTDGFNLRSIRGVADALSTLGYSVVRAFPDNAIRTFQRREGLPADGVVGQKTRARISERLEAVGQSARNI